MDEIQFITHLTQAGAIGVLIWQMLVAGKREERMAADIRRLEAALIEIRVQLDREG